LASSGARQDANQDYQSSGDSLAAGFLRDVVSLYQDWIRLPIYNAWTFLWPAEWPVPPKIGVDLLIIWCAFFAAASYHVYYEDGRNIFSHVYVAASFSGCRPRPKAPHDNSSTAVVGSALRNSARYPR
jgi:hypothetical protein